MTMHAEIGQNNAADDLFDVLTIFIVVQAIAILPSRGWRQEADVVVVAEVLTVSPFCLAGPQIWSGAVIEGEGE